MFLFFISSISVKSCYSCVPSSQNRGVPQVTKQREAVGTGGLFRREGTQQPAVQMFAPTEARTMAVCPLMDGEGSGSVLLFYNEPELP